MASDDAYMAFLNKANEDVGSGRAGGAGSKQTPCAINSVDTEIPDNIKKVDVNYVSDADEPFEPVALKCDDEKLDESMYEPAAFYC